MGFNTGELPYFSGILNFYFGDLSDLFGMFNHTCGFGVTVIFFMVSSLRSKISRIVFRGVRGIVTPLSNL